MTTQRWIGNLLDVATEIADREKQEQRWLAADAMAWERPEELIISLFDECNFESFLEGFESLFNEQQHIAPIQLLTEMDEYSKRTPKRLDPSQVLADPRWHSIRARASQFVTAFQGWPAPSLTAEAAALLELSNQAHVARYKGRANWTRARFTRS